MIRAHQTDLYDGSRWTKFMYLYSAARISIRQLVFVFVWFVFVFGRLSLFSAARLCVRQFVFVFGSSSLCSAVRLCVQYFAFMFGNLSYLYIE
jgi:hypothetical protein